MKKLNRKIVFKDPEYKTDEVSEYEWMPKTNLTVKRRLIQVIWYSGAGPWTPGFIYGKDYVIIPQNLLEDVMGFLDSIDCEYEVEHV